MARAFKHSPKTINCSGGGAHMRGNQHDDLQVDKNEMFSPVFVDDPHRPLLLWLVCTNRVLFVRNRVACVYVCYVAL